MLAVWAISQAVTRGWEHSGIRVPAAARVLVATQITLGRFVIWTERAVVPNTVHVGVGATVLATSLVLSLNSWRLGPARRCGGQVPRLREATP